ncbi:MAG: peptide deformylase [Pseudomonadota bacterium]
MTLLTVLEYPDKRLRNKAQVVTTFDATLQRIVDDMFETMYQERAVGLAATQVEILQRIMVMDVSDDGKSPICAINPEIIQRAGMQYEYEGCVSFPGQYDKVERAATVTLRAAHPNGEIFEMPADGLLAVCMQHEMDHLDGILFIDHLSRLKQERMKKKLEKARERVE